jgi:hypothetical protein
VGISAATARELWAHAREASERAERELNPAYVRRALVTLAVAGTGGDSPGFQAEVIRARDAARKVGMDPIPLFDAASAMVDPDDDAAREILVTTTRG